MQNESQQPEYESSVELPNTATEKFMTNGLYINFTPREFSTPIKQTLPSFSFPNEFIFPGFTYSYHTKRNPQVCDNASFLLINIVVNKT